MPRHANCMTHCKATVADHFRAPGNEFCESKNIQNFSI
jgi:hypothetical protein